LKLYENVVIGNFLYGLGLSMGAKLSSSNSPSIINLLQQTPVDKKLGDVLLEFPGVVKLLEFKQLSNKSNKEAAKHRIIKDVIYHDESLVEISQSVHWFVESSPHKKTFISRIVPYLNTYPDKVADKYPKQKSQTVYDSLEEFIQQIVEEVTNEGKRFTFEELSKYILSIATCQSKGEGGAGGLVILVNSEGCLRYAALTDMIQLRLQHREYIESFTREIDNVSEVKKNLVLEKTNKQEKGFGLGR
jgi:hypothetical protein